MRAGKALFYRYYENEQSEADRKLYAEAEAKANRRGLRQIANPTPHGNTGIPAKKPQMPLNKRHNRHQEQLSAIKEADRSPVELPELQRCVGEEPTVFQDGRRSTADRVQKGKKLSIVLQATDCD